MATAYGTDSSDDLEVLVEMTIDPDGTIHVTSVVVVEAVTDKEET